ncbi:hypothetical protein KSP40_PGU010320 [Platanthera guangdongensis]|uniref:Uncharacterized protein n=1 Tax=Platanthera guangdongensis TaxID=2320717 RepID=A0ABR2LPL9_9ASPA
MSATPSRLPSSVAPTRSYSAPAAMPASMHSANKLVGKHRRFSLQLQRRVHGAGIESISL